jgi:hypothetical protein
MCTNNGALFAAACFVTLLAISTTSPASADDALAAEPGQINPVVAKRVKGSYALDDGRTLRVSEKGRKLYADLGAGPVQIRHVGDEHFEAVGKEQDMRPDFAGGPFPHAVSLSIGSGREVASSSR